MKHSIITKFIAIVLCACSLVAVAFTGLGITFMQGYDLYRTPLETKLADQMEMVGHTVAWQHAEMYATSTRSNVSEDMLYSIGYEYGYVYGYGGYLVDIYENGKIVSSEGVGFDAETSREDCFEYRTTVRPHYPVVTSKYYIGENGEITKETAPEESDAYGIAPASERPMDAALEKADEVLARVADQEAVYSEEYRNGYDYDAYGRRIETVYTIDYYEAPEYTVRVYFAPNAMIGADFRLLTVLYPYRDYFIPVLLAALAVFAVTFVFLCTVAGRIRGGEVKLAAINRIPLDLYTVVMGGLAVALFVPLVLLFETAYYDNSAGIWDNPQLCLLICCLSGFGMALCIIGLLYAFAAQIKASNNYWLRHTVVGWCFRQTGRVLGWLLRQACRILGWLSRGVKAVGRGFRGVGRSIRAVVMMLPVIWQWVVTAAVMVLTPVVFFLLTITCHGIIELFWGFLCMLSVIADVAIVCYGGWCFGTLLRGIETMSKGDLNYKINTRFLYGSFKEFGEGLNSLAGVAKEAAERQTRSERMKTELITNVSHDIKTPLTSIINFVDLMKKPHSDAEGEEYLAVLDRQSQRLKKLIDDLMDMSKASSGNVTLELGTVDAAEAINQALGEFADKLERVNLTPVFRHPEEPVNIIADGKHLWRVLSNLLGNAVKYALPDTRLYVDLMVLQGNAVIAIKNISREQLNVDAEELMERFVRGDASRNTEGSGLGLNIARSLVELQGGQMDVTVDGDLFKVTLIFPQA